MIEDIAVFIKDVAVALVTITIVSVIGAGIAIVKLRQIGRSNRTTKDKISQGLGKAKRGLLKRVANAADAESDDELLESAVTEVGISYLNSFCNDVSRGFKVVIGQSKDKRDNSKRLHY